MKTVIFLFPGLTGHLNPSAKLAKYYKGKGCNVFYCGTHDLVPFTQKQGFKFYTLNSLPFASGFDEILHEKQKEKWLESVLDRHTDKLYKLRKANIEMLVIDLNPDLIFLDEFNYSDFVLLYPLLKNRRLIMLQTKFPMYYSDTVPPLTTYAFPGREAAELWTKYFFRKKWKHFWDYLKYFGKDDLTLLRQKQAAQMIPEDFEVNINKTFKPTFKNVEEWFLVPPELDFKQTLLPWQRYIGPMIEIDRKEDLDQLYISFIEKQRTTKGSRLIYCSLGSVSKTHLKHRKGETETFFNNIMLIAAENPDLFFLVVVEREMSAKLKNNLHNVLHLAYAPQMDILKKADVFLTHAGAGSVFEAIFCATPMILFPLNNQWDQNGTAARVVHHRMGIKADLSDSATAILSAIQKILLNVSFKNNTTTMGEFLYNTYHKDFLEKFFTEFLVQ